VSIETVTIEHPKKRAFVAALARRGTVRAACQAAGIGRTTYYEWAEQDDHFVAACGLARQEFADALEEQCSKLALREKNVTALIVALKMAGRFTEYQPAPAPPPRIYEREVGVGVAGDRVTAGTD
jgi:hypothetical protein